MDNKHFEHDYNKLVKHKLASQGRDQAMADSIGGNFGHFGQFQKQLLLQYGLTENSFLLDIGCGSGRLANALKNLPDLAYVGIDVVQDLLDYAAEICQRPDWQFIKSTHFDLPLTDNSVDMVSAFSVFTHLLHEESYRYLAEIHRVLKPNGQIVFSFLDFSVPEHWTIFVSNLLQIDNRVHLNQFISADAISVWAKHLQFEIIDIHAGNQAYIELPEPITDNKGNTYSGKVSLGQSVCVLQKPNDTQSILVKLPDGFDPNLYLTLNPDVAAANIDPAVHYLSYGQFEQRQWQAE